MVKFYAQMVIRGKKKWTDIRPLWQEDVCDLLKSKGYTLNDDGTVTKETNGDPLPSPEEEGAS